MRGNAEEMRKMPQVHATYRSSSGAASGSSSEAGITYEPESQRCRSRDLQACEQNGRVASTAGLPQIGHLRMRGIAGAVMAAPQ